MDNIERLNFNEFSILFKRVFVKINNIKKIFLRVWKLEWMYKLIILVIRKKYYIVGWRYKKLIMGYYEKINV